MKTNKLAVIGVGHVGSEVLENAALSGLFGEIVAIDTRSERAAAEALDQMHTSGMLGRANVNIYGGSYDDIADADAIVIAATHIWPHGEVPADRQALLGNNAAIIRQIMGDISRVTRDAVLVFITNPLDTVVYIAATEFGYPKEKIIGTGCTLDSSRLRFLLGRRYGLDPKAVNAFMMGEHGYTAFPLLGSAQIATVPYAELPEYFGQDNWSADEVKDKVVQAAYEVFHPKDGVTDAAVSQAATEILRSIVLDEKAVFSAATYIDGELGQHDIVFSIPVVIGANGVEKKLPPKLNAWEQAKLAEYVAAIRANIDLAKKLKQG